MFEHQDEIRPKTRWEHMVVGIRCHNCGVMNEKEICNYFSVLSQLININDDIYVHITMS